MSLLEINDLHVSVATETGNHTVLQSVNLSVDAGSTLCLVGESGSGKSVTAMSVLRLNSEPQFRYDQGAITFDGENILQMSDRRLRSLRGAGISMVFQDPTTSLNPAHRIGDQITETIRLHKRVTRQGALSRAIEVLHDVGIPSPENALRRYPHEFSGGMRQRALIAMALACEPQLIIADEPTTALDVTSQARILTLLDKLKDQYGLALLLVTHDLGVVAQMADKVAVMYAGSVVESGEAADIFYDPLMPYTYGLLNSRPATTAKRGALRPISGSPPRLGDWPEGCRFAPRCEFARAECTQKLPSPLSESEHTWRCVMGPAEAREARGHALSARAENG